MMKHPKTRPISSAQASALDWLDDRYNDGFRDENGDMIAGGVRAPFHRKTWDALERDGRINLNTRRVVNRSDAILRAQCFENEFDSFIEWGLLPAGENGEWSIPALDIALTRMAVIPRNPTFPRESVYFIDAEDKYVKIGYSGSPVVRMRSIQCSTPYRLKIIRTIPGGLTEEERIHKLFTKLKHRGEWYHKDPVLFMYIDWLKAWST